MTRFVDSFLFLFGGILVMGILLKLGNLLGGKKAPWLGVVFVLAGLVGGPVVLAALFDRMGEVERAVVVRKNERIDRTWNGGFSRTYSLDVKYPKTGADDAFPVRTDQVHYDSLAFGDPVKLRALPSRPSIARLEGMASREWLLTVMPGALFVPLAAIGLLLGGILLYGGTRTGAAVRNQLALVMIAAGAVTCYRDNRPFRGPDPPAEPTVAAEARVRAIDVVDELWATSRRRGVDLPQPYVLLELEFTPAGHRAPVIGVDAVDLGSIPYLAKDQSLAIRYEAADPRSVRVTAGTRRFAGQNPLGLGEQALVLAAVAAGFLLFVWALRRGASGLVRGRR